MNGLAAWEAKTISKVIAGVFMGLIIMIVMWWAIHTGIRLTKAQSDHQITYRYKDQGAATYYTVPHLLQSFYQSRPDPPESPKKRA